MPPRALPEWIGKTPDTAFPDRVKLRVLKAANHTCHICKLEIKTGDRIHYDHILALVLGGENKESNIAPAHADCNMRKAVVEVEAKAKADRVAKRHFGIKRPSQKIKSRGFGKGNTRPALWRAVEEELEALK